MNKRAFVLYGLLLMGLLLAALGPTAAQDQNEDEKIWAAFTVWIMTNPEKVSTRIYGEKLIQEGVPKEEVKRQIETIRRLIKEHPEKNIEISYDRIFSKPLTGDPEKDGFTSTPSVFMKESTKDLKPGTALDVGAGQGRNSVWLAQQGWDVTAIDISAGGLAAASANAEKAGASIATFKTTYQDYDFGAERWDLIVMILSWAPISDPDFVSRLNASLRPGGVLVFEHVLLTEKQSFPPYVQGLPPNALLSHFKDFHIQKYEEGVWPGEWGGPPAELVRTVVKKKSEEAKEENIDLVKRYIGVLNSGNYDELTELLSTDYAVYSPSGYPEPSSREKLIENYKGAAAAFNEFSWEIKDIISSKDKVIARVMIHGLSKAGLPGLPESPANFKFSMITIMRIKNGKIVEEWQEDDQLGFARQLGMELKPKEKKK